MMTIQQRKIIAKSSAYIIEISATVHDDLYQKEIKFNAIEYFRTITEPASISKSESVKAWMDLIECDFSGDYATDNVALFFENTTTAEVFSVTGGSNGFSCTVSEHDALAYLLQTNKEVFDLICKDEELENFSYSLN